MGTQRFFGVPVLIVYSNGVNNFGGRLGKDVKLIYLFVSEKCFQMRMWFPHYPFFGVDLLLLNPYKGFVPKTIAGHYEWKKICIATWRIVAVFQNIQPLGCPVGS